MNALVWPKPHEGVSVWQYVKRILSVCCCRAVQRGAYFMADAGILAVGDENAV